MTSAHILWRRLDVPGHDACHLAPHDGGWRLEGTTVHLEEGEPACLSYRLDCDARWHTREGAVRGFIGARAIAWHIVRSPDGTWTSEGRPRPDLAGCVDLDFGITPATNVSQLRRVALEIGESADVPAAWLDVATGAIEVLPQRYERRAERTYWYEAPRFAYAAFLDVHPIGFVEKYPTLWEAEAR